MDRDLTVPILPSLMEQISKTIDFYSPSLRRNGIFWKQELLKRKILNKIIEQIWAHNWCSPIYSPNKLELLNNLESNLNSLPFSPERLPE